MAAPTHSVLILRIPAAFADEISDRIWREPGVMGIEEAPSNGASLFSVHEDFEILEFGSEAAKRCAVWLENESFRAGSELLLRVYLDVPADFDPAALAERVRGDRAVGVESYAKLDDVDYLANYKSSVQGTTFGPKLWIGPPWAVAPTDTENFVVEPGLAFGTGGHPTTQLCFERLKELAADPTFRARDFLDLGTGTGILGVAVRKFFPSARLVVSDLDPLCENEVGKTFGLNHMTPPPGFYGASGSAGGLLREDLKFDCVVSNIYAEILAQIVGDVAQLLRPGGRWLVSGILRAPAERQLLAAAKAHFTTTWERTREQSSSQLDSQGGLKAIQETWVAYEFVKGAAKP